MSSTFSRSQPGPRYGELLAQYQELHRHGERRLNLPPEKTYNGASLPRHAAAIKARIDRHGSQTILDYGSGKGQQYAPLELRLADGRSYPSIPAYWGVETITCYDPAYEPFRKIPTGKFDGVICTDVLKHLALDDVPWIIEELFRFARQFVFANVACYAAVKHLPNGENAHCTVRPAAWWRDAIAPVAARHASVQFEFSLDEMLAESDGRRCVRPALFTGP